MLNTFSSLISKWVFLIHNKFQEHALLVMLSKLFLCTWKNYKVLMVDKYRDPPLH